MFVYTTECRRIQKSESRHGARTEIEMQLCDPSDDRSPYKVPIAVIGIIQRTEELAKIWDSLRELDTGVHWKRAIVVVYKL